MILPLGEVMASKITVHRSGEADACTTSLAPAANNGEPKVRRAQFIDAGAGEILICRDAWAGDLYARVQISGGQFADEEKQPVVEKSPEVPHIVGHKVAFLSLRACWNLIGSLILPMRLK